MKYSVIVCGSTQKTTQCAQALFSHPQFEILAVVTPVPKPIGRKKIVLENPLHQWAKENGLPIILVEKKIDATIREQIHAIARPDFLLVVDFGYIVPQWLLEVPNIAPVNIHPSDLPKYRGSSPGQFVLLFGETTSSVSFILMDAQLDHGPIIDTIPFTVHPAWTQKTYYQTAFDLASSKIADILLRFSQYRQSQAQPDTSPTPIARQLTRDDGFIPFTTFLSAQSKKQVFEQSPVPLLSAYGIDPTPTALYNLWRALTPWPGMWTLIPIKGKELRLKILEAELHDDAFLPTVVQLEGKTPQSFSTLAQQMDLDI